MGNMHAGERKYASTPVGSSTGGLYCYDNKELVLITIGALFGCSQVRWEALI